MKFRLGDEDSDKYFANLKALFSNNVKPEQGCSDDGLNGTTRTCIIDDVGTPKAPDSQ